MTQTYQRQASVENTPNIIETADSGMRWYQGEEMLKEGNRIFLLLPRCINVSEKKGNVMATDQAHQARVVEEFHGGFLLTSISSLVRLLTIVDGFIGDLRTIDLRRSLAFTFNPAANAVNLLFGKEVFGIIKLGAVTSRGSVAMVEVAIRGNMEIGTPWDSVRVSLDLSILDNNALFKCSTKYGTSKTTRATLLQNTGTLARG
jgi:hypothetical protein